MPVITELLARLGLDIREFQKNARQAEKVLQKQADKMISIGRDLTVGVTAPLTAIGGIAVKSFADFDDALRRSAAIMTGAEGRMGDLAEAARAVGRESTFGATEAAEAFFFLASAGFDAEKSIGALPKVVKFAEAGSFDLATATDLLTDAQSALGLQSKDAAKNLENLVRVSDVLVGANSFANASTRQFSEALTSGAGAAARNAGLEIEEVVAVLAAYADQGIKGADASTKFRVALRDLQSKAFENREEFEKLGITVFDSVTGALLPMDKILASLEKRFAGMSARERIATIRQLQFADKSKAALESLIGFSEAISINTKKLRQIGGVTDEVARKNLASFSSQMKILKNQVIDVAIALGAELVPIFQETIIPIVRDVIDVLKALVEGFSGLDQQTKEAIVAMAAFAASVGPALIAIGGFTKLAIAATNPVTILAAAVGAVTIGLVKIAEKLLISEDATKAYAGEMVGATKAMRDAAEAGRKLEEQLTIIELEAARRKIDDAKEALRGLVNSFADTVREGKATNETFRKNLAEAENLKRTIQRLEEEYDALAEKIKDTNKTQLDLGGGGTSGEGLLATINQLGEGLKGVAELGVVTGQTVRDSWTEALREMESESSAIYGRLGGHVSAFQMAANESWNAWLENSQEVFANVQLAAIGFLDAFAAGFGDVLARVIVFQEDFSEAFKGFLKNILAQVISTLTQIVVQWLLATILQHTIGKAGHIARVGDALQMVFLNTYASIAAIPVIGPAIAPGAAAAAVATASAGSIAAAAAGGAVGNAGPPLGLDTGGMLTADGLAYLHAGEVVATPDEVKDAMTSGRDSMNFTLMMDGRTVARVILPHVSREVNMRGA